MILSQLITVYDAGFTKISENADGSVTFGTKSESPVTVTSTQCEGVIEGMGWTKYSASIGKLMSHMGSFLRAVKRVELTDDELKSCNVTFEQTYMPNSTKNVWRTRMAFENVSFTIVEGRPGMGGRYAVMASTDGYCNFKGYGKLDEAIQTVFEGARPKGVYDGYTEEELRDVMEIEARVNGAADASV